MFNPRRSKAPSRGSGDFAISGDQSKSGMASYLGSSGGLEFFVRMYDTPPDGDISIDQIEFLTGERIKLLRLFEIANMKFSKFTPEWTDFLFKEIKDFEKTFAFTFANDADYSKRVRNDLISHYFCRLPYCRTDELRRWLLSHEVDLFKFRFLRMQSDSEGKNLTTNFLHFISLQLKVVTAGEKQLHEKWLKLCLGSSAGSSAVSLANFDNLEFYKVHFTQALDLVRGRRAYLAGGFLYVPHTQLSSIVMTHFRAHLSLEFARTAQRLSLMEDERITPRLVALSNQYLGKKYGQSAGQISVEQVEELAVTSFPLCMSSIHNALKEHKHAKHWARLQYGLFLKAIGLGAEDALVFWRKYLTKKSENADAFDKKYAYLFRHMYGKEGKKVSYSPYSCVKIQNGSQPGTADEFHGCPYKHNPVNVLSSKLDKMGLVKSEINEVMEYVSSKNYCMACTKTFEVKHRIQENLITAITHPNQYFEESSRFTSTGSLSARMRGGNKETEAVPLHEIKQQHESFVAAQKESMPSQEDLEFMSQNLTEFDEDF